MDKEQYKEFIRIFFKCLGFKKIRIKFIRSGKLYGKVYYKGNVYEDIRWDISTYPIADSNVIKLVEVLAMNNLVDIDKIKITRNKLYSLFTKNFGKILTYDEFLEKLKNLLSIKIDRIDKSIAYDWFYIHE